MKIILRGMCESRLRTERTGRDKEVGENHREGRGEVWKGGGRRNGGRRAMGLDLSAFILLEGVGEVPLFPAKQPPSWLGHPNHLLVPQPSGF